KPLLRLYRVEAKSIERRIREDTAAKIASIQATLKKRRSKQANQIDPSSAHPAERKAQTRPSNESVECAVTDDRRALGLVMRPHSICKDGYSVYRYPLRQSRTRCAPTSHRHRLRPVRRRSR